MPCSRASGRLGFLFALATLAACQPLPQPFAHEEGTRNALLALPDSVGVAVRPVTGLTPEASAALTGAVVEVMQAANVPASAGAMNVAAYRLSSAARLEPSDMAMDWWLDRPDGIAVWSGRSRLRWVAGRPSRSEVAAALAPAIRIVQEGGPAAYIAAPALRLVVLPVEGAPGDGRSALTIAMAGALRRLRTATVLTRPDPDALVLAGEVRVGRPAGGKQRVEIAWTLRAPDGRELGTVSQANEVPAGSLDGRWGETAALVAEAATGGIAALVEKARDRAPAHQK